jgi:hypothetical protein
MMKTFGDSNNHIGTRIRRGIDLLLASCFFLGVVALAMHHHDAFFQLKNCAICKAKTSFSGTLNKVMADHPPSIATVSHVSAEVYFSFSRIILGHQTPFIATLRSNPFSNKAPPCIS